MILNSVNFPGISDFLGFLDLTSLTIKTFFIHFTFLTLLPSLNIPCFLTFSKLKLFCDFLDLFELLVFPQYLGWIIALAKHNSNNLLNFDYIHDLYDFTWLTSMHDYMAYVTSMACMTCVGQIPTAITLTTYHILITCMNSMTYMTNMTTKSSLHE